MRLRINNIRWRKFWLFFAFFFGFSGYYVGLMLMSNSGMISLTRFFSVPIRLVILVIFFFLYKVSNQKIRSKAFISFIVFSSLYLLRIFYEIVFGIKNFQMPKTEYLLYFLGFVLLPFLFVSQMRLKEKDYQTIFRAILISSFILSVLTYYFYSEFLGEVGRILIDKEENYISPLALSYCSSLVMGVGLGYMLTNKTNKLQKTLILLVVAVALIPFFLGASRGSIISLAFPFVFYFVFSPGIKNRITVVLISTLAIGSLIYATSYLGTGIFDRFIEIEEAIDTGENSAYRIVIWKESLKQFMAYPVFGNSLQSDFFRGYPHNVLIETLITTGVLGFIPFIFFIFFMMQKGFKIIRNQPEFFWLFVIFAQALSQYMFSGAIWGMSWVAIGAGLLLGKQDFKIFKS